MATSWLDIVSLALNIIFGSGFLITFIYYRSELRRRTGEADQAAAMADSAELDNVEKAIRIWREIAQSLESEVREARERSEQMQKQNEQMAQQLAELTREVSRLRTTSNRILSKINKMNHDNFYEVIEQIKNELQK